ncbi:hypothetical protein [Hephaestia mangrovi]|uniref:hypothetical protein n=1 Tax=Hephaestia mangrovi TaxID=2873268 RepID=UPI001CA78D80|nr:hypothetical protein [Hephaestia mangrovi]MBY8827218.1 hypothetical protein [Hephaestia mangrovi]
MILLWLMAVQATTYGPVSTEPEPVTPPNQVYAHCAGSDPILHGATHVSWAAQKSVIAQHRELRKKLGADLPESDRRILWYAVGGDLATQSFSVVATRNAAGLWHVSGVGQTLVWIKGAKPSPMPSIDRTLDAEESSALDKMLADPCLYAGPTFADNPHIHSGGLVETLEVETPEHLWVGGWHGMATDQEQAITNLLGKQ